MSTDRKVTPLRAVRVSDALWDAARAVAQSRGESVSDVVRAALQRYVKRYGKEQENADK